MHHSLLDRLKSSGFVDYLSQNGLAESSLEEIYQNLTHKSIDKNSTTKFRYFRLLNVLSHSDDQNQTANNLLDAISDSASVRPQPVTWLPDQFYCYSLPESISLKSLPSELQNNILGIDAASLYAVWNLNLKIGQTVLDLCCCPGGKLSLISELVGPSGYVVGVDISPARLRVARNILKKICSSTNIILLLADGTTFDPSDLPTFVSFDFYAQMENRHVVNCDKRIRSILRDKNSSKEEKDEKIKNLRINCHRNILRDHQILKEENKIILPKFFDRVLVDAECTHDGSTRHLQKFDTLWGWESFSRRVMNADRLSSLSALQSALLRNGLRLLNSSSAISADDNPRCIYSTCSLCPSQDEDIVNCCLEENWSTSQNGIPIQSKELIKDGSDDDKLILRNFTILPGQLFGCFRNYKHDDNVLSMQGKSLVPAIPVRNILSQTEGTTSAALFLPHLDTAGLFVCALDKVATNRNEQENK